MSLIDRHRDGIGCHPSLGPGTHYVGRGSPRKPGLRHYQERPEVNNHLPHGLGQDIVEALIQFEEIRGDCELFARHVKYVDVLAHLAPKNPP